MVTDGNWTYHGDCFRMYIVVESLQCTLETYRILYVNYMSIKIRYMQDLLSNINEYVNHLSYFILRWNEYHKI